MYNANDPIIRALSSKNKLIQLFGLPSTYKTSFLLYLSIYLLNQSKNATIYIVDLTKQFPVSRLQNISMDITKRIIIFRPSTIYEEISLFDDLELFIATKNTILFVDDIFRLVTDNSNRNITYSSLLLVLLSKIAQKITFPIVITNQARKYGKEIYPYLSFLTNKYVSCQLFFNKKVKVKEQELEIILYDNSEKICYKNYQIIKNNVNFSLSWNSFLTTDS